MFVLCQPAAPPSIHERHDDCQLGRLSIEPSAASPAGLLTRLPAGFGVKVSRAYKKVDNVSNRTDCQAYIGDCSAGHCRDESRPDMMKYVTVLCLSLGLAGCFGFEPYASATGPAYGPVPDLGACARSPEAPNRVDQLCNRQDGNPYGSN